MTHSVSILSQTTHLKSLNAPSGMRRLPPAFPNASPSCAPSPSPSTPPAPTSVRSLPPKYDASRSSKSASDVPVSSFLRPPSAPPSPSPPPSAPGVAADDSLLTAATFSSSSTSALESPPSPSRRPSCPARSGSSPSPDSDSAPPVARPGFGGTSSCATPSSARNRPITKKTKSKQI